MLYYPKGEMCMSCTKFKEDCSGLPFETMPPHKVFKEEQEVQVICTSYDKVKKDEPA